MQTQRKRIIVVGSLKGPPPLSWLSASFLHIPVVEYVAPEVNVSFSKLDFCTRANHNWSIQS